MFKNCKTTPDLILMYLKLNIPKINGEKIILSALTDSTESNINIVLNEFIS